MIGGDPRAGYGIELADDQSGFAPESAGRPWRERLRARPAYALRAVAALGAMGIVLFGALPMAVAATNPVADPILNEALEGTPFVTNRPAWPFDLVDQYGKTVSLQSPRGRVLAVTFLDPVRTTDCPLIAQELQLADKMLGTQWDRAEFVAIATNPIYHSVADTQAFDQAEGLAGLSNWLYLTGSLRALEATWARYGVLAQVEPAGAMVAHSDIAYVIDASGHARYELDADPGRGSPALRSSFAGIVAAETRTLIGRP